MKSIYDFFIPNIIYDSVSYAKHLCDNHIDNLVSASIPHSVFEGYSASRYLHASHFYADTLEFSVEKSVVMTYINSLPGRTGYLWNNLTKNFGPSIAGRFAMMLTVYMPRRVFITLLLLVSCFFSTALLMAINQILGTIATYLALLTFIALIVMVAMIDGWILERKKRQHVSSRVAPSTSSDDDDDGGGCNGLHQIASNGATANVLTPPESAESMLHNQGNEMDRSQWKHKKL